MLELIRKGFEAIKIRVSASRGKLTETLMTQKFLYERCAMKKMDEICTRLTGSVSLLNLLYNVMVQNVMDMADCAEVTYAVSDYTGIAEGDLILLSDEL